jgi:hypothetical protein
LTQQPNTPTPEPKKNKQTSVQELVESLRGVADDVGQISELTSEEKSLVSEFFKALLNFMNPLSQGLSINPAIIHSDNGVVQNAHIDPTGHLALLFEDGHLELKDLSEERNRDLLITVVQDAIPKFKQLTNQQKRKVESRIKFLSAITKDMQKISGALSAAASSSK